ncbi:MULTISPECIES: cytochrome P450 [unclassified Streptomyces]|uniref:cytochrome P450 n=1 Tax=unclassified Streptomyces TaxID=2593676 RepID=UPI00224F9B97|nr:MULTISPECIES: cytochrome P450 [unclassified Streptomyces]MCX4406029.1 cytochrome P450 [Streptomyces sp. NBC_01764]MCX5189447.1 cytochrome P450 [Streptomyces sp. NBC_00268]
MATLPSYPHDIFTADALVNMAPHLRAMRRLGPLIRLEAHDMYALTRYEGVRRALADHDLYLSGEGVALNPLVNEIAKGTTLHSDGEAHDAQRRILNQRLRPHALKPMADAIQTRANELVESLTDKSSIDAVTDLARALPVSIVPDLVGWPEDKRDNMLQWAAAAFDAQGPLNARAEQAMPKVQELFEFASTVVAERTVLPGSAAAEMLDALDEEKISTRQAISMVVDYLAPSLDTTISAIGSMVWLFSRHPDQWRAVQEDPQLVPNAVLEVVRLESPVRAFSRVLAADATIEGHLLPAGTRIMVLFASANRDEGFWGDDAESFDVRRHNAAEHVGFGHGLHGCAGQGLARLEIQSMLRALIRGVDHIELLSEPTRSVNNLIHAFAALPVRLHPLEIAHTA